MNGVDNGDYAHPQHSSTDPIRSTPFLAPSNASTARGSNPSDLTAVEEKDGDSAVRPESRDAEKLPVADQTRQDRDLAPRKRHRFMGLLGRPDSSEVEQDEDPDLVRTDTRESKRRKRGVSPWKQFKEVLFGSWVNVLLICVPVGFAVKYAHLNGYALFVVNFIAIIPLAAMLSFATEELALYVGETLGGLLNATFGNATELIGMLFRPHTHNIY